MHLDRKLSAAAARGSQRLTGCNPCFRHHQHHEPRRRRSRRLWSFDLATMSSNLCFIEILIYTITLCCLSTISSFATPQVMFRSFHSSDALGASQVSGEIVKSLKASQETTGGHTNHGSESVSLDANNSTGQTTQVAGSQSGDGSDLLAANVSTLAGAGNNSDNTSGTESDDGRQMMMMYIIITTNIIIFVIGFWGNAVVILVILKFTRTETVTDIYILNLAMADLMFTTGLVFLITTMFVGDWIFGNLMCKLYMATTSLNQFASSLLLVVMSFDRFLAVCHPIYAQRFRQIKRAKIICFCIWIICLILMSPLFAFARIDPDKLTCAIFWPEYKSFNCEVAFTLYSFAIGFAVPLLLIAGFYSCVIRKLRSAASGAINLGSARRSRTRETANRRIEHLVIGIICTYTVCWLPYWIAQLCVSFSTADDSPVIPNFYEIFLVATCLSYTNSALNPILYAFLSDNFKRRCSYIFQSIYSFGWCKDKRKSGSHSTVATACGESEASRPESRNQQAVLLNESTRILASPIVSKSTGGDHHLDGGGDGRDDNQKNQNDVNDQKNAQNYPTKEAKESATGFSAAGDGERKKNVAFNTNTIGPCDRSKNNFRKYTGGGQDV